MTFPTEDQHDTLDHALPLPAFFVCQWTASCVLRFESFDVDPPYFDYVICCH